jgi:hypothetical protein
MQYQLQKKQDKFSKTDQWCSKWSKEHGKLTAASLRQHETILRETNENKKSTGTSS